MKKKEVAPSAVHYLYRYLFRGVGWVLVAGIATWLLLFFRAGGHR